MANYKIYNPCFVYIDQELFEQAKKQINEIPGVYSFHKIEDFLEFPYPHPNGKKWISIEKYREMVDSIVAHEAERSLLSLLEKYGSLEGKIETFCSMKEAVNNIVKWHARSGNYSLASKFKEMLLAQFHKSQEEEKE